MRNTIIILTVFILLSSAVVRASEFELSGNGSGTTNSVTVNSGTVVNILQNNTSKILNNIDSSANSGGNNLDSSNGGKIQTGDANSIIKINNVTNQNSATVLCCTTPTPTKLLTPTPAPVVPTSSPSSTSSTNSTGTNNDPVIIGGAPVVLGLSNTSSESEIAQLVRYALGIVCVVMSLAVLRSVRPA